MQPVNTKSLLHFLFDQMEKLDKNEIDVPTAQAQASLAKQTNNIFTYELKRAETELKLEQHRRATGSAIKLRNIEAKPFDE